MDASVSVCPGNTNVIMVWAWMLWSAYSLGTRTFLWCRHGFIRQRVLRERDRYYGLGHECFGQSMLSEHESRYGLGMDAFVSACFGNMNVIMVWAWMLWSAYALGTQTLSWFGHGCFGQRMLWERKRFYGVGMDAFVSVCSGNATVIMVWGMNALVRVCSRNTKVVMVWAWMLLSAHALGT